MLVQIDKNAPKCAGLVGAVGWSAFKKSGKLSYSRTNVRFVNYWEYVDWERIFVLCDMDISDYQFIYGGTSVPYMWTTLNTVPDRYIQSIKRHCKGHWQNV
jgi:hypothetical protein